LQNSEHRQPPNYLEKEVRQHDNLVLKRNPSPIQKKTTTSLPKT
jgi:hypothetical protein